DAVMATFGTPMSGPDDASRALRCAVTLAVEIHRWSAERVAHGEVPVEIGIGAHYGDAVVGSIGDGQRLDYLVIGDTVNVTSRLSRSPGRTTPRTGVPANSGPRVPPRARGGEGRPNGSRPSERFGWAPRTRQLSAWPD